VVKRFPEVAETQPELLAHHYTEAGLGQQAVHYWRQAGERATRRSANLEAIGHFTKGLEVLHTVPEWPESAQCELALQTGLGPVLMIVRGFAAPEVEHTYARARALCQRIGATPQMFPVLWGLYAFYLIRAEFATARELAEQLLHLAQHENDPALLVEAHYAMGALGYFRGEFHPARHHLEQSIALYDREQSPALARLYGGQDPGVWCHQYMACILWFLGYPDQALRWSQEAHHLAETIPSPFALSVTLHNQVCLYQYLRDVPSVQEWNAAARAQALEQGDALRLAYCTVSQGWILVHRGASMAGLEQLRQGVMFQMWACLV
jgi:tetratricopeptide (TPR) repeat protein